MAEQAEHSAPAVQLQGIVKRFPGVVANRNVNLRVAQGEIHAIVGENGAGKSTLMRILYGMQRPDEGTIAINGEELSFKSPTDAISVGIGMVHQHFMLADNLTVLENIILGGEPRRGLTIDFKQARSLIIDLGKRYGLAVDPDEMVEALGVGERQRVEILKVLYRGARILILDEPTAVLVPQEVEELFGNLRELKAEGITILFISHKLHEVLSIADAITVIRAGTTVAEVDPAQSSAAALAQLMVGSELPVPEKRDSTVTDEPVLAVEGLCIADPSGRSVLDDISFTVHRGEVVGIAGVEGNGQSELIEAVMGLQPLTAGRVLLGPDDVSTWSTRRRRESGLGFVPEDRQRHGLLLDASLWENEMLGHQTEVPNRRGPWIDRRGARARTTTIMADYDVRAPSVEVAAQALSGGNQQKLIIGREMAAQPRALVAAHPTRGVDVGAQAAIWAQLRDARAAGLATLLISADLEELIGLSDTLLVMYRGRVVARLDPAQATPEVLGLHMTGASGAES